MKEKSIFIEFVGDSPRTRVWDYLLEQRDFDFCISDMADNVSIGRIALYSIWKDLIKSKIIFPTRTIGKAKLFKLNTANEKIKKLIEIDDMLIIDGLKKKASEISKNKTALVDV